MGHYEKLMKLNIADAVEAMGLKMDYDGRVNIPYSLKLKTAWIEQGNCPDRLCLLWLDIFFTHFQVIHPGCMSCWKIFYKPKTLRELYDIYEMQKHNEAHGVVPSCKCGIETRPYSGNLGGYGAFWYNPLGCGLDQARENLGRLKQIYGKKLLLKRGCTEMEQFTIQRLGVDSTKWDQLLLPSAEKLKVLEEVFFTNPNYRNENRPLPVILKTEASWIRHAAHHGDLTYLDFTDGKLIPSLHIYGDSIDRGKDIDDGHIWRHYNEQKSTTKADGGKGSKSKKAIFTKL